MLMVSRFRAKVVYPHVALLATRACDGAWASLSPTERSAWSALDFDADSWEGRRSPHPWRKWADLSSAQRAAAIHGLGIQTQHAWEAAAPLKPTAIQLGFGNPERPTALSVQVAQVTRQSRSGVDGVAAKAWKAVKAIAPILGPLLRNSARGAKKGAAGAGLAMAGLALENLPTALDTAGGMLDVTGVETVLYLDDSGSMCGNNLHDGHKALKSLESRLRVDRSDPTDERFLPTRIVKFGTLPQVLTASDEDWNATLASLVWDGSSGMTFMWKMIELDVLSKYRPAGGKLRVVVITDGADVLSPGEYRGVRGFNPLMKSLLQAGFDIEWHIIVVGDYDGLVSQRELSDADQALYASLCHATGGSFVSVGSSGWDENANNIHTFLEVVEASGREEAEPERRARQEQYRLDARSGKARDFEWLPALPKG